LQALPADGTLTRINLKTARYRCTNGRNRSGKSGNQPSANDVSDEDRGISTDVSFYHVIGVNTVPMISLCPN
jgi:hypothetical protein